MVIGEKPDTIFNITVTSTERSNSITTNQSVIAIIEKDQKSNESVVLEISEGNSTVISELPLKTDAAFIEGDNSSTFRSKRENSLRVVFSRGCKRLDFIDGFALAQRSDSGSNATERVYAQLCSSDLCNSGDGRASNFNPVPFFI